MVFRFVIGLGLVLFSTSCRSESKREKAIEYAEGLRSAFDSFDTQKLKKLCELMWYDTSQDGQLWQCIYDHIGPIPSECDLYPYCKG